MSRQANAGTWIERTSLLCVCLLGFAVLTNAQTGFSVKKLKRLANGSVTLAWPVVQPTGTYHVAYANSPAGPWQVFTNGTIVAPSLATSLVYTDLTAATVPQRFYKILLGRTPVIMTLVLDRSGSMNPNDGTTMGGTYLPGAVTDFINDFSDNYDQAAMVTFATIATADVPLSSVFRTAISTAVNNVVYLGGTFSVGGLTNALLQYSNVSIPPGSNAVQAVVFFTDGQATMIEQPLNCPPQSPWIIGGFDIGNYVGFWPANTTLAEQSDPYAGGGCWLSDGGYPPCCGGQNYFVTSTGVAESFLRPNVTAEAGYEAVQVANQMRAQGIYVYAIGLNADTNDLVATNFLQQVANDPGSPTYNATLPTGAALIITNATDLDNAFQSIAASIPPF